MVPEQEEEPPSCKQLLSQDFRFATDHLTTIDDIPRNFGFGDQMVPVEDEKVRYKLKKQINRFSKYTYGNKVIRQRLSRYEETFRRILRENGIPEDFVYLAVTESNLSNAISPVGAKGFWQFMPATARQYGLEVSESVDERYHPEKATYAAARYLRDSYEEFEDWFLVAASYNMGTYGVMRQLRKQDVCSYFELDLNRETSQYVYKILAYKAIFNQPFRYGTDAEKAGSLPKIQSKVVSVDKSIGNLSKFATQHGTDLESLKALNPWLISNSLNVRGSKTYRIQIPLDDDLRVDELAVEAPQPEQEVTTPEQVVDTLSNAESLVQEKAQAITIAPDSSKQV